MHIKIRGGTVEGGDHSLCLSCRYSTILKGMSLKQERVICEKIPYGGDAEIRFPVKECSGYDYKANTSIHDMYGIAWILRTDGKGKSIGFVPYKQLTQQERDDM